ncbi:MAG: cyanophycinase [Pirellulaceae bacterium]
MIRRQCFLSVVLVVILPVAGMVPSQALLAEEAAPYLDPAGLKGTLVLAGGGELPPEVLERFVKLAGGEKALLVLIPTASELTDKQLAKDEEKAKLLEPWAKLGIERIHVMHTRSRDKANDAEFVAPLRHATAVWLEGGQQSRLAAAYLGTEVERELYAMSDRGGVIGGTSAGAAIMSRVMIEGGNPEPRMATGLDLLPGTIVDQHFLARGRKSRLISAVSKNPGLVGFGVDEGTALFVSGRKLEVVGKSSVTAIFAAAEHQNRAVREIEQKSGSIHDYTMLRRAALARTQPAFPPKDVPASKLKKGSLVIVGGGGMPADVTAKFIELAGGPEAPIVVLPTANPPVTDDGKTERREGSFFERAGAKHVTILPQRTREEVESPEFEEALKKAKGVWFGGGRQWRFVDCYAGTKAEKLIRDVLDRGGVIGGSSAGATIQGDFLVRGSVLGNEEMMAEGYERGLGYLPGSAIDQHFTQRKRFPDMTSVMKRHPQILGIGIDETTAVVVQGETALIMGKGNAHFYDYRKREAAATDAPDYIAVKAGEKFNLVKREKVAPPKAD